MATSIEPHVGTSKARLAAIARHHGKDSIAYQLAKAELERAVRLKVVRDVAEAFPYEFRRVAQEILGGAA